MRRNIRVNRIDTPTVDVAISTPITDKSIQAYIDAQQGLIQERANLVNRVAEIDRVLGGGGAAATVTAPKSAKPGTVKTVTKKKRTISPEGREKMAEAARKRWAAKKGKKRT